MHGCWRFLGAFASLTLWSSACFAETALERIQQQKQLRVCIVPQYFGITYRDPRTLQLGGIDIDMSAALAQDLGVKLSHVEITFPQLIESLTQGRCDVAMFAVAITPQRQQHLSFTTPYLQSGLYAVTTKANRRIRAWDDIDKPGRRVGVPEGTYVAQAARQWLKHAEPVLIKPDAKRSHELESGRIDAYLADLPDSRRMASESDWLRVLSPPTPLAPMPRGYAIKQGDPAWLARLNSFVNAARRDGRLHAAAQRQQLTEILLPEGTP